MKKLFCYLLATTLLAAAINALGHPDAAVVFFSGMILLWALSFAAQSFCRLEFIRAHPNVLTSIKCLFAGAGLGWLIAFVVGAQNYTHGFFNTSFVIPSGPLLLLSMTPAWMHSDSGHLTPFSQNIPVLMLSAVPYAIAGAVLGFGVSGREDCYRRICIGWLIIYVLDIVLWLVTRAVF